MLRFYLKLTGPHHDYAVHFVSFLLNKEDLQSLQRKIIQTILELRQLPYKARLSTAYIVWTHFLSGDFIELQK